MASKQDIKTAVNKLIKGKKMMISAFSSKDKEELKDRIQFAQRQVQSGNVKQTFFIGKLWRLWID